MKNLLTISFFALIFMGGGCGDTDSDNQWTNEKCQESEDYGAGYIAKEDGSGCELSQAPGGEVNPVICGAYSGTLKLENDLCYFKEAGDATTCPAKGGTWVADTSSCQLQLLSDAFCKSLGQPGVKDDKTGCKPKTLSSAGGGGDYSITLSKTVTDNSSATVFLLEKDAEGNLQLKKNGLYRLAIHDDCVSLKTSDFASLKIVRGANRNSHALCDSTAGTNNNCSPANYKITISISGSAVTHNLEKVSEKNTSSTCRLLGAN